MVEYFSQILIPDFLVILMPKEWKTRERVYRTDYAWEGAQSWKGPLDLAEGSAAEELCWDSGGCRPACGNGRAGLTKLSGCPCLPPHSRSTGGLREETSILESSSGASVCRVIPRNPGLYAGYPGLSCTLAVRGTWDLCPPLPWQCPSWAGPSREKSSARPPVPNHNPAVSAEAVPAPFTPSTARQCMGPPIRAAACLPGREATSAVCVFSACRAKGLTSTSALGPQVRRLAFSVFKTR